MLSDSSYHGNDGGKVRKIKLTLYTKKNCSLCDQAKEQIEEIYDDQFEIEEVDITKDKSLFRKFKFDIPVFYHNGAFLMQHRVDRKALDDLVNQVKDQSTESQ